MIRFYCHRCGTLIQSADTAVGRNAMCPGCSLVLVIPAVSTAFPPPPPPPAPTVDEDALDMPEDLGPVSRQPPVVAEALFGARRSAIDEKSPPPEVPIPPGPPAMVSLAPGTLPVPVGGMPVPRPGASLPLSGLAPPSPRAVAFEGILGEACDGAHGPHPRLPAAALLSKAALRRLGIAAIAMGTAGALFSWVPFAGLSVAVIGLAAGTVATIVSSSRRDGPMRLALAGTLVGLVGAACGAVGTAWSLNKGAATDIAQADATHRGTKGATAPHGPIDGGPFEKPLAPDVAAMKLAGGMFQGAQARLAKDSADAGRQNAAKNDRPRLVFGGTDGNRFSVSETERTPRSESAAPEKRQEGATATPIKWAAAEKGEPQGSGPFQVTVSKVVTGKVVTYPIGDLQTLINVTAEPYLIIWLKIKDTDAAGSAEFAGWMNPQAEEERIGAQLVDDHGREHKPVRPFNKDEAIQNTDPPGKISAGQSAKDAVVFRLLPDDVDSMDLTLSGKAIGSDEDLHFRIPRSMITKDNSNPLLGGAGN